MVNSAGLWSCGVSVVLATDYRLRTLAVAETMQASTPGYTWLGTTEENEDHKNTIFAEFDLSVENGQDEKHQT